MMMKKEFEELRNKLYQQATAIGCCDMFSGKENIEELIDLVKTIQGFTFCSENNFPTLAAWREFDAKFGGEKYGVFVDRQEITIKSIDNPILVGKTTANVHCDKLQRYCVTQLCGAHATIYAENWAVVKVRCGKGCVTIKKAKDKAIIL